MKFVLKCFCLIACMSLSIFLVFFIPYPPFLLLPINIHSQINVYNSKKKSKQSLKQFLKYVFSMISFNDSNLFQNILVEVKSKDKNKCCLRCILTEIHILIKTPYLSISHIVCLPFPPLCIPWCQKVNIRLHEL